MDVCKYSLFSSYSPYYKIQGKIHSHLLQSNAMGITKSFYKEKILKSSVPVSDGKIQGYKRGKGMETKHLTILLKTVKVIKNQENLTNC